MAGVQGSISKYAQSHPPALLWGPTSDHEAVFTSIVTKLYPKPGQGSPEVIRVHSKVAVLQPTHSAMPMGSHVASILHDHYLTLTLFEHTALSSLDPG